MSVKGVSEVAGAFLGLKDDCLGMQGLRCRACAEACSAGAIRFRSFAGGYAHPEHDPTICDGCGACLAACPLRSNSEAAA
ncbi:MAG: 4Fe-4S dicluster domain-containing protein [Kiloniellales bacterium]|nr:4Fe-4S dicluster domain-containing protein [Kiloniellales bacterium]